MASAVDRPRNPYPQFFTQAQWHKLLQNDAKASLLKSRPVVKLFTPDANACWLLCSVSPEEPDLAFGLCDLGQGFPELGYVSLAELATVRGALGLPVERDRYCTLKHSLGDYADRASTLRRIEA